MATAKTSTKKTSYFCLRPVKHGGEYHTDKLSLTEEEAAPLLECGAIGKKRAKTVVEEIADDSGDSGAAEG